MREDQDPSITEQTAFNEVDVEALAGRFPGRFEDCSFDRIKLSTFRVKPSLFLDCKFTNCNLSGATFLGSGFSNVQFIDCNLMGLDWTSLNRFENGEFRGCKLDFSNFEGLKLKRLVCVASSLKDVDFSGAHLSEADFSDSILRGTIFTKSDLSKANFKTAKEYCIDPTSAKIKGAKFCLPEAVSLLTALGAKVEYS